MLWLRRFAGVAIAASSAACSSSGTATADAGAPDAADASRVDVDPRVRGDAQAACARRATAYCARLASCYPTEARALFGNVPTCEATIAIACTPTLLARGSTTTPADVDACAAAIPGAACEALFGGNDPPDACKTKRGTLTDGATCGFGAQCASARCAIGGACGQCAAPAGADEACTDTFDCAYGLVCADGACAAPRGMNEACNARRPCKLPLICDMGNCAAPLPLGEPCRRADDTCDRTAALYCTPYSECDVATFATRGACGPIAGGGFAICAAGTACWRGGTGVMECVPLAPFGAACDDRAGPGCLAPATCVNHVCVVKTEASCL